jgi:hypothetical protein
VRAGNPQKITLNKFLVKLHWEPFQLHSLGEQRMERSFLGEARKEKESLGKQRMNK